MIFKMMYCPYKDSTRDIWSNIPLCLQELPWALPSGTPSGKGVYLTVYPSSRPNTDTVYPMLRGYMKYCPSAVYIFLSKGQTILYLVRNVWYLVM